MKHIILNCYRSKGREIKDGYDRLERLAAQGPNSKEFVEPKVQNLWLSALKGNFTYDELESIRVRQNNLPIDIFILCAIETS